MAVPTWSGGLLVLVGGARSGKSRLAVDLAAASPRPVVFVATAEAGDAEMGERIDRHRAERPPGLVDDRGTPRPCAALSTAASDVFVIVDCLTSGWRTWCSLSPGRGVLAAAGALAGVLAARPGPSVVVTNEVGMGVHPRHRSVVDTATCSEGSTASWRRRPAAPCSSSPGGRSGSTTPASSSR